MDPAPALFVIGTGRSGTTALYEFLCSHPDTTWISNYSQRVPPFALAHPCGTDAGKERAGSRLRIRPVEGYRTFDRALQMGPDGRLVPRSPWRTRRLEREISLHRHRFRRDRPPVFVSKNTRNTRGMALLDRVLPGSRFLFLTRHPLPTVSSMIKVGFFDSISVAWEGRPMTVGEAATLGADRTTIAATLWNDEMTLAIADQERIDTGRVLRLRFEDLTSRPRELLAAACTFGGLDPARHPGFERRADEFEPRGDRQGSDPRTIETVGTICGATAARLGYEIGDPARFRNP